MFKGTIWLHACFQPGGQPEPVRCATFGLPQHEFLTWASNFLLIMRHKCPENVKIAIKTLLCTYGFRDFSQKLKITTFALFGASFFHMGIFCTLTLAAPMITFWFKISRFLAFIRFRIKFTIKYSIKHVSMKSFRSVIML